MDYLAEIKAAIRHNHGCESMHDVTVHVREVFQGQIAWDGEVEVFHLIGHAKAKRCYAWGHPADDNKGWEFTTVLEIPPVVSPQTAVKVAIAAKAKSERA